MNTFDANAKKTRHTGSLGLMLLKGRTFIALAARLVYFSLYAPNFTEFSSIVLMIKHAAIYGLLALGMTLVIITGGIDLSVGAVVGLSAMLAGGLVVEGLRVPFLKVTLFFNVPAILLIVCAIAVLVGLCSGFIISELKVPAFIATLGAMYVCRGFAMLRSGGATFPNLGSPAHGHEIVRGYDVIGSANVPGTDIPYTIVVFLVMAVISAFVMNKTPLGNQIYAVGGNERAATLSGIKTKKVKRFVYMYSSFLSAVTGLIMSSQLRASHPSTGDAWEMNAIAAVVLGGTSMSGGVGTIGGTIIGVLVITVLNDGMIMMGVSSFWQMVIKGVVIVLAVVIDLMQQDLQRKASLQARD
jgi:ribose/xylose/arabinose/galactoside ABC-type transport system permease subunit